MENIKKIVEEIIPDENQRNEFIITHENAIKDFFAELWNKQLPNEPLISETQKEEIVDTTEEITNEATNVENQQSEEVSIQNPEVLLQEEIVSKSSTDTQQTEKTDMPKVFDSGTQPDKENAKNEALTFQIKNKQITFLNGKVNQEYSVDFDFANLEMPEIAEVSFEGLETIGLQYLPDEKKIKGMPTQAGDHKITMYFKRKDWEEGKPLLQREIIFIINPDPRVLWSKNIPTPEDIEYYKPDSDKDFVKVESKKVKDGFLGLNKKEIARKDMVVASQRGRSHAIEGKPRDDDFALYFDEQTDGYVMAVADGAGSAPCSR
jgi:hypothetical protein